MEDVGEDVAEFRAENSGSPGKKYLYVTRPDSLKERKHWTWDRKLSLIEAGNFVIDVGAGFGSFSLNAVAQGARVFAFEADGNKIVHLRHNIWINDDRERGYLEKCAVHHRRMNGSNQPLDEFLDGLSSPPNSVSLLRIANAGDGDGVLRGASTLIEIYKPNIIMRLIEQEIEDKVGWLPNYTWSPGVGRSHDVILLHHSLKNQ